MPSLMVTHLISTVRTRLMIRQLQSRPTMSDGLLHMPPAGMEYLHASGGAVGEQLLVKLDNGCWKE